VGYALSSVFIKKFSCTIRLSLSRLETKFNETPIAHLFFNYRRGQFMNQVLKRTFIPNLLAASLVGASFIPAQPASADDLGRDTAVGAGVGVVSGAIRGRGSVLNNAVRGAASGAAVHGANRLRKNPNKRNLGQDIGVGAAAGAATGAVTGRGRDTLGNAIDGAAAGAVINILNNNRNK
jgi:hypothetical protein